MKEKTSQIEFKEHVRKRPAMYLGASGNKGAIYLVKGLILDANRELETENNFFHFLILENNRFELVIKTTARIENYSVYQYKDESNFTNYHQKVLKALSQAHNFEITSKSTAKINWSFDENVMGNICLDQLTLCDELTELAFLNRESEILITDNTKKHLNQSYYSFPEGVKYVYERCKIEALGKPQFELSFDDIVDNIHYQIYLGYRTDWFPNPQIMSYANEIHTSCGGSLVDGIMEGFILGCRQHVKESKSESFKVKKNKIKNGLILICSVKGENFEYGGSFKESLIDKNVKSTSKKLIKNLTLEFIERNKEKADKFLWRFDESQLTSGMMTEKAGNKS